MTSPDPSGVDQVGATGIGVDELIAGLRGQSRRIDPRAALRELSRRRPREAGRMLGDVLADDAQPADLRALAARALARRGAEAQQGALLQALRTGEPTVVRRAAEALAHVGDREVLDAVRQVDADEEPVRRSLRLARTLIAHRLGVDDDAIAPPDPRDALEVDEQAATPLEASAPDQQALRETTARLRDEIPTLSFPPRAAAVVSCPQARYLVRLTDQAGPERLQSRKAVAAVVMKWSSGLDRYYIDEYLLTDPTDGDEIQLLGLRASGEPTHAGTVTVGRQARFTLRTVDARHAPPIAVEGSVDTRTGAIEVERGLVEADAEQFRSHSRTPPPSDIPLP